MEASYMVKYKNDEIIVPIKNTIKDLTLLFLKDWGVLVKFYDNEKLVTPSFDHNFFPVLNAIDDGHQYTEYKEGQYRCFACRKYINRNLFCNHDVFCRRKKINSTISFSSTSFEIQSFFSETKINSCRPDNDEENKIKEETINLTEMKNNEKSTLDNTDCVFQSHSQTINDEGRESFLSEHAKEDTTKFRYMSSSLDLVRFYQEYFPNMGPTKLVIYTSYQNFVAFQNGIVGAVSFEKKEISGVEFCYVSLLSVCQEMRRKGIGRKLWMEVLKVSRGKVVLWVDDGKNSRNFYKKMGVKRCCKLGYALQLELGGFHNNSFLSYVGLEKEEIDELLFYNNRKK